MEDRRLGVDEPAPEDSQCEDRHARPSPVPAPGGP
jgi:hypothetical protein